MKKQKKQLIGLLLALVIIVVGYFGAKMYSDWRTAEDEKAAAAKIITVFDFDEKEIDKIRYVHNVTDVTLVKEEDDTWTYTDDPDMDVSEFTMAVRLHYLSTLKATNKIENVDDLSKFKMDRPIMTVTFWRGDQETVLQVGTANSVIKESYLYIEDDPTTLYTIDFQFFQYFSADATELVQY